MRNIFKMTNGKQTARGEPSHSNDADKMFFGNPLTTFVGKKIEAATRPELESEDWQLNVTICDIINDSDEDAKDAARAIKKRLQQIEVDRNFIVTNRTLTLLEACVANCSRRFHVLVMTKDYIQDLVKLIGPKNNPPVELQERILSLIERWAEAFGSQPECGGVVAVYNDLKTKGVTFPVRDPSADVPIQTPQRSIPSPQPPMQPHAQPVPPHMQQYHPVPQPVMIGVPMPMPMPVSIGAPLAAQYQQQQPMGPVMLEGDGYNRISQDLVVVQSNIKMFGDVLRALKTNDDESNWKLASDLHTTCSQMKQRIVDLIEQVANEDLTIELLSLNDDMNNIFVEYDSMLMARKSTEVKRTQAGASSTSASSTAAASVSNAQELTLIDFNTSDDASTSAPAASDADKPKAQAAKPVGLHTSTGEPLIMDPFDSNLVEEALSKVDQKPAGTKPTLPIDELGALSLSAAAASTSGGNAPATDAKRLPAEVSSVREQDFAEIENWLSTDSGRDLASIRQDLPSMEPTSIPDSEFENFIASRALAGASTAANNNNNNNNNNNYNTGNKTEQPRTTPTTTTSQATNSSSSNDGNPIV